MGKRGIGTVKRRQVAVSAGDDVEAMHDLLSEVLNAFLIDGFIWCEAAVTIDDGRFATTIGGEVFDPERHHLVEDLKAVTYHNLRVEETAAGWRAVIVFDA